MTSCETGSTNCHFTCPNGGTWRVCSSEPYFVGCCAIDPCTNTTAPACPDPYLFAASFDPSIYGKILPNDCIGSSSTDWYTCSLTSPPFLGCCKDKPCGGGCPRDALVPAAWSPTVSGQFELFADGLDAPKTTIAPSSTSTSTSTSPETSVSSSKSSGLSSGAIVGIVIGGVVALCITFVVLFLQRRYSRKSSAAARGEICSTEHRAYNGPFSPYQDSHQGSPGPNAKHISGSSAGFTLSPSSPRSLESYGQISEIYSKTNDYVRSDRGLHISGAPTVQEGIPELHSDPAPGLGRSDIHELDGIRS